MSAFENGVLAYDLYGTGQIVDDNLTDIGPALQAALNTAASNNVPVFLRAGRYMLKTPITIPSGGGIWGAALNKTVITWGGSTTADIFTFSGADATHRQSNLVLRDFTLQGGTTNKVVNIQHADNIEMTRVKVVQTAAPTLATANSIALFIGDITNFTANLCVFESSGVYTVYHNTGQADDNVSIISCKISNTCRDSDPVTGALQFACNIAVHPTRFNVSNNEIGPSNGSGCSFQGGYTDCTVSNNRVFLVRRLGLESSNGTVRVAMVGNIIDYTGQTVLHADSSYGISVGGNGNTVAANVVQGVVGVVYGIEVVNSPNAAVNGNTILNCDRGIETNTSPRSTIVNNVLETLQFWAIRVYQSDDVVVDGNVIHNFGQGATGSGVISGVFLDQGGTNTRRCIVEGNTIDGGLKPVGASYLDGIHCNDVDNQINHNTIRNLTAPDDIIGIFAPGLGSSRAHANIGFNPVGNVAAPAVPASTVTQTNSFKSAAWVFVAAGTVTVIAINGVATGMIAGAFRVDVGQTIAITYTVAPTWTWFLE